MKNLNLLNGIDEASKSFGITWPLYSFVTSNPLSGYEQLPFDEALKNAEQLLKAKTYPSPSLYKQAWENNEIDGKLLSSLLEKHAFYKSPESYLNEMLSSEKENPKEVFEHSKLDVIMTKWLSAFMDEGLAEWQMPNKSKGFYLAWKYLAKYDSFIGKDNASKLPSSSIEAIQDVVKQHNVANYTELFKHHLAALSGWVGYIKHRENTNSIWQQKFPITIQDYLAVRLTIAHNMGYSIVPESNLNTNQKHSKLEHLWLQAWEQSFQKQLLSSLKNEGSKSSETNTTNVTPDAQMVFCIDTRSEAIRRHVESKGNYETFGYAGFFGIAMDYQHFQEDLAIKSCPPIVGSPYLVTEKPLSETDEKNKQFTKGKNLYKSNNYILKRLKNMLPSSFGFVEGAGVFYGASLLFKTFIPEFLFKQKEKMKPSYEAFCEPEIKYNSCETHAGKDISLDEKVAIVKSGFDLMGWKTFAPLVLFIGHGSHTTNNPFGSSLDCGACAASPGRHNARLLAKLANDVEVRAFLKNIHNINIPDETVFIGGEHNTTTDEITLFDNLVPETHTQKLEALKVSLHKAQETATADRLATSKNSIELANKKSMNWGETRPEWGLAKNAGFIIAPRKVTEKMNLKSRCFMHSYDYEMDDTGAALEGIMCGPMVVTQWINNHYYFTTVDNNKFGSGSKITHNITGKFGVVQGNGGDLKMGLPLQSLKETDNDMYHQPLRLTVVIKAPLKRVESILKKHNHLKELLDNEWIYLKVMDTDNDSTITHYHKNLNWVSDSNFEVKRSNTNKKSYKEELELSVY